MAGSTDFNPADARMGVWSHFYGTFWSEWFIILTVIGAL